MGSSDSALCCPHSSTATVAEADGDSEQQKAPLEGHLLRCVGEQPAVLFRTVVNLLDGLRPMSSFKRIIQPPQGAVALLSPQVMFLSSSKFQQSQLF